MSFLSVVFIGRLYLSLLYVVFIGSVYLSFFVVCIGRFICSFLKEERGEEEKEEEEEECTYIKSNNPT